MGEGDGEMISDPMELLPNFKDVEMIFAKHADFKTIEKLDPFRQRKVFRDEGT